MEVSTILFLQSDVHNVSYFRKLTEKVEGDNGIMLG